MSVICLTITRSCQETVAGIPNTVSISTNIASSIFYTLDGSAPTLFSNIYTGPIIIPFNTFAVVLSVFATNGTISSPIITETYQTDPTKGNVRVPHSATSARPGPIVPDKYPFGDPPFEPNQRFLGTAKAGITVDDPNKPSAPTAFDGAGNPTAFTNKPYDTTNYQIVYSNTNAEGQQGRNIGNLPAHTKVEYLPPPAETTDQFTSTFDPRAMVVFQDFSKEDPNDPPIINKQYFSMDNPDKTRDGDMYFNAGQDATAPVSGAFVRSHYNPRTNEMTYYYRDAWSNKWLISTAPYQPNGTFDGNLAQTAINNRGVGANYVQEWRPWARRYLF